MSNSKYATALIIMLVLFISCKKDDANNEIINNNDGHIDDSETMIMTACSDNLLSSKSDIENNLIGEWTLIGYGSSLFPEVLQPSINLTISNDQLIIQFKNEYVETLDTLIWEIIGESPSFGLATTPKNDAIISNQFCDSYMYGSTLGLTSSSSKMYLYEKVE